MEEGCKAAYLQMSSNRITRRDGDRDNRNLDLLEMAINSAVDGIIVICSQSRVRLFNRGAEKLFGFSADEILGRDVKVLMPALHALDHAHYVQDFIDTGQSNVMGHGRPITAVHKSGEIITIHLSLGFTEMDTGPAFVAVAREINLAELNSASDRVTQDKLQEIYKKLNQVGSSSLLSEMVRSIAHELNQPLSAITTYAGASRRLVSKDTSQMDEVDSALEKISQQAVRSSKSIEKLRELAERNGEQKELLHVEEMLTEIRGIMDTEAKLAGCRIRWFLQRNLPKVWANASQIHYVLVALLRNSLESVSNGTNADQNEVHIRTELVDSHVVFSIRDFGNGVNAGYADTLFHPFTTTKSDNIGLGLTICSTIMKNHGGQIWFDSASSFDCRFFFTIPVPPTQVELNEKR